MKYKTETILINFISIVVFGMFLSGLIYLTIRMGKFDKERQNLRNVSEENSLTWYNNNVDSHEVGLLIKCDYIVNMDLTVDCTIHAQDRPSISLVCNIDKCFKK